MVKDPKQNTPVETNNSADITGPDAISKPVQLPKISTMAPGLYPVATPIGNLRDITLRALDVLNMADLIVCEDTRITRRLLNAYEITTPLMVYHDHNAQAVRPKLIARLQAGERIALVTDAGTPLVSDPGYKLVREVTQAGIQVFPIPGAAAPIAALVTSGLPSDRFLFAGFPPVKQGAKRHWLEDLSTIESTLILFESPKRLPATMKVLGDLWPTREAAVAREITKKFEEVRRDTLENLALHYAEAGSPKGEIVIVIGPPAPEEALAEADAETLLVQALESMSVRDAAATVAKATGQPKKSLYARALELSAEKE